jgi:hypothetical protein
VDLRRRCFWGSRELGSIAVLVIRKLVAVTTQQIKQVMIWKPTLANVRANWFREGSPIVSPSINFKEFLASGFAGSLYAAMIILKISTCLAVDLLFIWRALFKVVISNTLLHFESYLLCILHHTMQQHLRVQSFVLGEEVSNIRMGDWHPAIQL